MRILAPGARLAACPRYYINQFWPSSTPRPTTGDCVVVFIYRYDIKNVIPTSERDALDSNALGFDPNAQELAG